MAWKWLCITYLPAEKAPSVNSHPDTQIRVEMAFSLLWYTFCCGPLELDYRRPCFSSWTRHNSEHRPLPSCCTTGLFCLLHNCKLYFNIKRVTCALLLPICHPAQTPPDVEKHIISLWQQWQLPTEGKSNFKRAYNVFLVGELWTGSSLPTKSWCSARHTWFVARLWRICVLEFATLHSSVTAGIQWF